MHRLCFARVCQAWCQARRRRPACGPPSRPHLPPPCQPGVGGCRAPIPLPADLRSPRWGVSRQHAGTPTWLAHVWCCELGPQAGDTSLNHLNHVKLVSLRKAPAVHVNLKSPRGHSSPLRGWVAFVPRLSPEACDPGRDLALTITGLRMCLAPHARDPRLTARPPHTGAHGAQIRLQCLG